MQKGNFLSETSYYVVEDVAKNGDLTCNIVGTTTSVKISKQYADSILVSANDYIDEKQVNQTELINMVLANPRTAMSVKFKKADKDKTKKAYETEKNNKISEIRDAKVSDIERLLSDLIDNPISKIISGEERVIVGYHTGLQDERGYLQFFDAEKDNVFKAINTRTFEYAIINKAKYVVK